MSTPIRLTRFPRLLGQFPRILALLLILTLVLPATAVAAPWRAFPEIIPLPDGFQPEGIATGNGSEFFVGSLATGAIYHGDLQTGAGAVLVQPPPGRVAVGLDFDQRTRFLYVAGGPTGAGYVYDSETGATVAVFQFTTSPTFVNDVVVTPAGAFFTDSSRPVIYYVPTSPSGDLLGQDAVKEINLGGAFTFLPGQFNANGIDATPDGKFLIVVHTALGALYRVQVGTWEESQIDLGGAAVPNGDGLLLQGRTLYVAQNFLNQIAVVQLSPDLQNGQVERTITNPNFRIPTTIAEFGDALYAVNARFDVTPTPDTSYEVVRVPKR